MTGNDRQALLALLQRLVCPLDGCFRVSDINQAFMGHVAEPSIVSLTVYMAMIRMFSDLKDG